MSVYYNWDITKRREKDKKTSLQLSERAPPDWGLHPELATIVDRRGISSENAQKGDSQGDSPNPLWNPALSSRVTTGGLSALSPDGRQGAISYGLMGPRVSCAGSTS
jgi:hypothetical protein